MVGGRGRGRDYGGLRSGRAPPRDAAATAPAGRDAPVVLFLPARNEAPRLDAVLRACLSASATTPSWSW